MKIPFSFTGLWSTDSNVNSHNDSARRENKTGQNELSGDQKKSWIRSAPLVLVRVDESRW